MGNALYRKFIEKSGLFDLSMLSENVRMRLVANEPDTTDVTWHTTEDVTWPLTVDYPSEPKTAREWVKRRIKLVENSIDFNKHSIEELWENIHQLETELASLYREHNKLFEDEMNEGDT